MQQQQKKLEEKTTYEIMLQVSHSGLTILQIGLMLQVNCKIT